MQEEEEAAAAAALVMSYPVSASSLLTLYSFIKIRCLLVQLYLHFWATLVETPTLFVGPATVGDMGTT